MTEKKTTQVVTLRDHQKMVASNDVLGTRAASDSPVLAEGVAMKKPTPKPDAMVQGMPMPRRTEKATPFPEALDHTVQSAVSRFTQGLSPAALLGAWPDWATHIAAAPGKQLQLGENAADKIRRQSRFANACAMRADKTEPCTAP